MYKRLKATSNQAISKYKENLLYRCIYMFASAEDEIPKQEVTLPYSYVELMDVKVFQLFHWIFG